MGGRLTKTVEYNDLVGTCNPPGGASYVTTYDYAPSYDFQNRGLPPPDPDWGGMINEARAIALAFPHMPVFPCLAISSLILGFNLLADGLREISLRD